MDSATPYHLDEDRLVFENEAKPSSLSFRKLASWGVTTLGLACVAFAGTSGYSYRAPAHPFEKEVSTVLMPEQGKAASIAWKYGREKYLWKPFPFGKPVAGSKCQTFKTRKEWRTLTIDERKAYISAIQCLMKLPAKTKNSPLSKSRYDDFTASHILESMGIHSNGPFHAWHRHFLWLFEDALVKECNFKGAHPYWDWTLDSKTEADFVKSPVWDAVSGFGGNGPKVEGVNGNPFLPHFPGHTGGGCVTNGPFKNYSLVIQGPQPNADGTCLTRDFVPAVAVATWTTASKTEVLNSKTWTDFNYITNYFNETGGEKMSYHIAGHIAIGGEFGRIADFSGGAVNDPIFFLHHASIDWFWATWQAKDAKRLTAESYSGALNFDAPPFGTAEPIPTYWNSTLSFANMSKNITIGDAYNTQVAPYCYKYV